MFATVILLESLERLVIPIKYVLSLDILQIYNRGISRTKKHIIYYSPDDDDEPNFQLAIKDDFEENVPACYKARILNVFGKLWLSELAEKIRLRHIFYFSRYQRACVKLQSRT